MMSNVKFIVIVAVLFILGMLYYSFQDSLPPRTPRKIARNISGLPLTNDYNVLSFDEEWNNFNGDGSLQIEIEVKNEQLSGLIKECNLRGYRSLPIINPPPELDGALFLRDVEGLYNLRIYDKDGAAFDLVILDKKSKKLMIYVFVS